MSAWRALIQEVYLAGGTTTAERLTCSLTDIANARALGVLGRCGHRGPGPHEVRLSALGWALCEGRAEFYVPFTPRQANGGRAPGTHRRVRATWLASLPRANEVRLTPAVHRAQNDGTCYW